MGKLVVFFVALLMVSAVLSRSTVRRFLDVNCDQTVECTDEVAPVCGTDGQTYNNKCLVDLENQKKVCVIGDFNPVMVVHEGNCNETKIDGDS